MVSDHSGLFLCADAMVVSCLIFQSPWGIADGQGQLFVHGFWSFMLDPPWSWLALKIPWEGKWLDLFLWHWCTRIVLRNMCERLLTARCWCRCKGDWIFVSKSCNISPKSLLSLLGFCCVFESAHSPGSQGTQLATFCSLFLGSFVQMIQGEPSGQMSQSCHDDSLWVACLCGHLQWAVVQNSRCEFPWWRLLACASGTMTWIRQVSLKQKIEGEWKESTRGGSSHLGKNVRYSVTLVLSLCWTVRK